MLSDHQSLYQRFYEALQQFQQAVNRNSQDQATVQADFLQLQQFFQQKIASFSLDELAPEAATQVHAIQTEVNKQLRLLAIDVSFLRAARQTATAQKRRAQMNERLNLLRRYCEALIAAD